MHNCERSKKKCLDDFIFLLEVCLSFIYFFHFVLNFSLIYFRMYAFFFYIYTLDLCQNMNIV